MKADYERQTATLTAVLENLTAERAELANGVDHEHPALVAFISESAIMLVEYRNNCYADSTTRPI